MPSWDCGAKKMKQLETYKPQNQPKIPDAHSKMIL